MFLSHSKSTHVIHSEEYIRRQVWRIRKNQIKAVREIWKHGFENSDAEEILKNI
jgi:hypothetical protein